MEEDFYNFVDSRINTNYYKIRENEKWKEQKKKFEIKYQKLKSQLTEKQKEELEEIINISNILRTYENTLTYNIAFKDAIKLMNI